MSGYSAGRRNEAYGSVTRVVIGSPASTPQDGGIQRASPATTWRTPSKQDYLALQATTQRGDAQRPPTAARFPPGSENRPAATTTTRKTFAVTAADEVRTWEQQRAASGQRPEYLVELRRAGAASASVQHISPARQHNSMVLITISYYMYNGSTELASVCHSPLAPYKKLSYRNRLSQIFLAAAY